MTNKTYILGPCSIETEDLFNEIGSSLVPIMEGKDWIYKASFDKANRSSIDGKRGPGIDESIKIFKNFKKKYPNSILFSYTLNSKCIGYGGLTNIDWNSKKAELSFLVDDKRYLDSKIYAKDFFSFLNIIIQLSFLELKFNRLFTETYNIRKTHLQILKKVGFKYEGRLKQHTIINDKYIDSIIHGYLQSEYIKKNNFRKNK